MQYSTNWAVSNCHSNCEPIPCQWYFSSYTVCLWPSMTLRVPEKNSFFHCYDWHLLLRHETNNKESVTLLCAESVVHVPHVDMYSTVHIHMVAHTLTQTREHVLTTDLKSNSWRSDLKRRQCHTDLYHITEQRQASSASTTWHPIWQLTRRDNSAATIKFNHLSELKFISAFNKKCSAKYNK